MKRTAKKPAQRVTLGGVRMPDDRRRFVVTLDIDGDQTLSADNIERAFAAASRVQGAKTVRFLIAECLPQ